MNTAFVTGANGFIASALCRRLLRQGVHVRALCRAPAKGQALASAGAEIVGGDVQDSAAMNRLIAGCDAVFHLAAARSTGSAAFQYNINVEGTRNVIQAAHKMGAARFVHVSTIAVYGYEVDGPIDETRDPRPSRDDFYMQTKALGEAAAWAYARRSGMPTVVIRPAMVYGPGSMFWSRALYNVCRRYPVPLFDGGEGHAHPIFVDDVVDLLVTAATHPAAPGHTFHAAPDPAPSWREFLGCYAVMAGNTSSVVAPTVLLKPLGVVVTPLLRLTGHPTDLTGILRFITSHATYRMDRAADILGWWPAFSLGAGMALTETWLNSLP